MNLKNNSTHGAVLGLFIFSSILTPASVQSQALPRMDLRGIAEINPTNTKLPKLTTTGVSIETTSDLGLVSKTSSLERQRIELPSTSAGKSVIDVYAGTSVESVTLFAPATFTESRSNTSVDSGNNESYPYICSAHSPSSASYTTAGTYTDPTANIAMATGPGEAPKNAYGNNQAQAAAAALRGEKVNPNALAGSTVAANTVFARQSYLSSGSFGNGLANTGPLQVVPFPSGLTFRGNNSQTFPDCGG